MKFDAEQFIKLARQYEKIERKICKSHKDCERCPYGGVDIQHCSKLFGNDFTEQLNADYIATAVKTGCSL